MNTTFPAPATGTPSDERFASATFGGARGLPAAAVAACVHENGAAFLRHAVADEIVGHYRNLLGVDRVLEEDARDPATMRLALQRSSRNLLTHHSYADVADPLGLWFASSPLADIARGVLGRETIWVELESSYFREALPPRFAAEGAGYHSVHNDGWFAAAGGMANFWIALTPCGIEAPSLEIVFDANRGNWVPPSLVDLVDPLAVHDQAFDDIVAHFGAGKCWHPAFEPGDVILFHHFTHHRTYFTKAMTRRRLSIEFRVLGEQQAGKPGLLIAPDGSVETFGLD